MQYAGLIKRILSYFIDVFLLLIFYIFITSYFINKSFQLFSIFTFSVILFRIICEVIFVKLAGGSPGKLIFGIIILKDDGTKVGWKESIIRYIIEIILSVINDIIIIIYISSTTINWGNINNGDLYKIINNGLNPYTTIINFLIFMWVLSEFIVLNLNKRKKGLQDYLAGTIVIIKNKRKTADNSQ